MIKSVLYFLVPMVLAGVFANCGGTRKTTTEKAKGIEVNNTYSTGENVYFSSELTYTPLDAAKPMFAGGKTYLNAVVSNKAVKETVKWRYKHITKTITITKTKFVERTDYTLMGIGVAFVIVAGIVAYFKKF